MAFFAMEELNTGQDLITTVHNLAPVCMHFHNVYTKNTLATV